MICPFCSLLCDADDLNEVDCSRRESSLVAVTQIPVWHGSPNRDLPPVWHGSPNRDSAPANHSHPPTPLTKTIDSLRSATRILVTGRIASVQTARAAIAFAAKCNATIDCAEHGHVFKNTLAIQRTGLNSVSLAEARDHSDLLIVIGNDGLLAKTPRMPSALANEKGTKRTVLLLGDFSEGAMASWRQVGFDVWFVPCPLNAVPNALSAWSRWSDSNRDDVSAAGPLFELLAQARYTTVLWSAENLPFEQADLWVERILQWIASRNETARCAALPWSSLDGTFQQVCTWRTGFPGRIAFRDGIPQYDPARYAYRKWFEKKPEDDKRKSVLVVIDETASTAPFLHDCDVPEDIERVDLSTTSQSFPTAIAGAEVTADMFRADQTLLARVEPTLAARVDARSAAHWLEALSQW